MACAGFHSCRIPNVISGNVMLPTCPFRVLILPRKVQSEAVERDKVGVDRVHGAVGIRKMH